MRKATGLRINETLANGDWQTLDARNTRIIIQFEGGSEVTISIDPNNDLRISGNNRISIDPIAANAFRVYPAS